MEIPSISRAFPARRPAVVGLVLATLALWAAGGPAALGADPVVLPNAETVALPQRASNGRDYILHVGFPLSYDTAGPERRYPVVYVCDGYWDFPLVATAADLVRRDGHAPETIVVGIGYGGSDPDEGLLRQWDLTPGIDEEYDPLGEKTGHADEFMTVLEREIIPFVERAYRADPNHRVLLGSSFGGLFAIYTAFQRPDLFQGIVVSSPAVYWRLEYPLELARGYAASGAPLNTRMFISWGSGDSLKLLDPAERFARELAGLAIPGLRVTAREVAGGGHSGNKPESFTRGLRYVFAPQAWEPPGGTDPGYGEQGRFLNISTRGLVQRGDRVLIAGLTVEGILPKRVLVRAAGPSLAAFGVSGVLQNPRFRIADQSDQTVAENDDWGAGPDPAAVTAAGEEARAFAFTPGSRDAALVVRLDPGQYTIVVSGPDASAEGVALVEAYELTP